MRKEAQERIKSIREDGEYERKTHSRAHIYTHTDTYTHTHTDRQTDTHTHSDTHGQRAHLAPLHSQYATASVQDTCTTGSVPLYVRLENTSVPGPKK